jgi:hypothetical protein
MQVFTQSFSLELFQAIHDFRVDDIRIALYPPHAELSDETEFYTPNDEIEGDGYEPGGAAMPLTDTYPKIENARGAVRFDRAEWEPGSTFRYQKALIYNASKDNRSIFVIDFGTERGPENGSHFIELPNTLPPFLFMNRGVA